MEFFFFKNIYIHILFLVVVSHPGYQPVIECCYLLSDVCLTRDDARTHSTQRWRPVRKSNLLAYSTLGMHRQHNTYTAVPYLNLTSVCFTYLSSLSLAYSIHSKHSQRHITIRRKIAVFALPPSPPNSLAADLLSAI